MDACAMLAYIQNEPGAEAVEEVLMRPNEVCLAHAVNLCEVYYKIIRTKGELTANQVMTDLRLLAGIVPRNDMDEPFWNEIGRQLAAIRDSGNTIAMADCFAIALAIRTGGTVITSDHHEFDYVRATGICNVHFFR
jgi:PIN domain nuclease of toxin-antitoxin system